MTRGFQPNEAKEAHALDRIGKAQQTADDAHLRMLSMIRAAIDAGVRAQVIADHLEVSRPTLYRMLNR
jgi:predicted DNA-binding transcriptional regulator YafY